MTNGKSNKYQKEKLILLGACAPQDLLNAVTSDLLSLFYG